MLYSQTISTPPWDVYIPVRNRGFSTFCILVTNSLKCPCSVKKWVWYYLTLMWYRCIHSSMLRVSLIVHLPIVSFSQRLLAYTESSSFFLLRFFVRRVRFSFGSQSLSPPIRKSFRVRKLQPSSCIHPQYTMGCTHLKCAGRSFTDVACRPYLLSGQLADNAQF